MIVLLIGFILSKNQVKVKGLVALFVPVFRAFVGNLSSEFVIEVIQFGAGGGTGFAVFFNRASGQGVGVVTVIAAVDLYP
jgi:hypothetical protein